MEKAEEIFKRHIGSNAELGYIPIKKEDVIDAINEALSQHDAIKSICDYCGKNDKLEPINKTTKCLNCDNEF